MLAVTVAVQPLEAGSPTELEKNPPVTFASPAHPWSFSAGVTTRSIDADFHLSAPALNPHMAKMKKATDRLRQRIFVFRIFSLRYKVNLRLRM